MLTIGSLFSGIGGLELGLERAGLGPVKWQVEIDPYCRAVLAKHWPDARRYEDVRVVGPELERVDVVCGGFPCQDISLAGEGAGIDGDRSGLWRELARVVRVVRPRYVVVENVSALASRGLDRVLGDLSSCGFDAEWDCISASALGAPHARDRIFVVAYPACDGPSEQGWAGATGKRADCAGVGRKLLHLACDDGAEELLVGRALRGSWAAQPGVGRVAYGVPSRVDRIGALGNAVVPQVAEVVGHVVLGIHRRVQAAKGE